MRIAPRLKLMRQRLHGSLIVKLTVELPAIGTAPETTAGGVTGVMANGQPGTMSVVEGAVPPTVPAFATTEAAVSRSPGAAASPMPAAASASRGDSFFGVSGNAVPEMADATATMCVWMELGMLGGAPGKAIENWPGSTSTVAPPEVKATLP